MTARRRTVAVLAAVLSVPALVTASHSAPAGAATSGYTLENDTYGTTPNRLRYFVQPGTPHAATLAARVAATVRTLQGYGLEVAYGGYGAPRLAAGVVDVAESTGGCALGGSPKLGVTEPWFYALPNGARYTATARVRLCPTLFARSSAVQAMAVRHEMGHSVGLGHFDAPYAGRYQTMYSSSAHVAPTYESGDVNGLRYLASHDGYVRGVLDPVGHWDTVKRTSGTTVRVGAWALATPAPATPVSYRVTANGFALGYLTNNVVVAAVNAAYHVGGVHGLDSTVLVPGGALTLCLKALTTMNAGTGTSLGCRSV